MHTPVQASMLVINADKSGGITGHFGIVQETRDAHTAVEMHAKTDTGLVQEVAQALLDQQSWKPLVEGASPESVTKTLQRADTIVTSKATPDEARAYRQYIMDVARKTASATKESSGMQTSDKEKVALQQIAGLLHLNG
jgi:hypothetical protein